MTNITRFNKNHEMETALVQKAKYNFIMFCLLKYTA